MEMSMALLVCGRCMLRVATPSATVTANEFMFSILLAPARHPASFCQTPNNPLHDDAPWPGWLQQRPGGGLPRPPRGAPGNPRIAAGAGDRPNFGAAISAVRLVSQCPQAFLVLAHFCCFQSA